MSRPGPFEISLDFAVVGKSYGSPVGRRFCLSTAAVQGGLGVAVGLSRAFEDEVDRGREGDAGVEVGGHRVVGGVGGVLLVDDGGEPAQAVGHLLGGDDAVP